EKIRYYLENEKEREEIAAAGQKFILENYNYKNLMMELDQVIKKSYNKFFPDRK
ncbi:MAG: glycosyltransferase family 1 protein, partial [Ignavibacteria bacterium]|nr:glycosyltransferase family 1 protein [Ignavibacteria bacterium]